MWKRADERERRIRRRRSLLRFSAGLSFFVSALFVFNHMLGWYGYHGGMRTPLPPARAAIEFVIMFAVLFVLFFFSASLRTRSGRSVTNVVICPSCKKLRNRSDLPLCECGCEYEDLVNWKWVRQEGEDSLLIHSQDSPPLNLLQRIKVWLIHGLAN